MRHARAHFVAYLGQRGQGHRGPAQVPVAVVRDHQNVGAHAQGPAGVVGGEHAPGLTPPACMNRVNPVGAIRVEGAEAHEGFQFGQLG